MVMACKIGVLALQGDFSAHLGALRCEGIEGVELRYPEQLETVEGLILPGGESTTHLKLLEERGFADPIRRHHRNGGAVFGTCAGAILVALKVTHPEQPSLGLIDIDVRRNAYGRQRESFETIGPSPAMGEASLPMVFIRAPVITRVGADVEVLASMRGDPVLVRHGSVLAATFHPELAPDCRVHRYFAEMAATAAMTPS
jgi:5'-phosphate synthase pdxT subunit